MSKRSCSTPALGACSLLVSLLLGACSGGGGNSTPLTVLLEAEPNDAPAQARAMSLKRPASGEVSVIGDEDWWSIELSAGQVVQIEMFAARLDHASWDAASNAAQLKLFAPDGVTELLGHYPTGAPAPLQALSGPPAVHAWNWGQHDLDIPLYRAQSSGAHYLRVSGGDPALAGGEYALVVTRVSLPGWQVELEPVGVSGVNDIAANAQPITAGTIYGFHVDDGSDFYSFTVSQPTYVDLELVTYRNGLYAGDDEYFDPEMFLYDTDGVSALNGDDDTYFYDSCIQHWIATPGTYFIEVTECCDAGDGAYFLRVRTSSVASPTAEVESNDTFATAQAVQSGQVIDAQISNADDDYYSIAALAGDTLYVKLFDEDNRQDADEDVIVVLLAPDGVTQADFLGGGGLEVARALLPADGTYFVRCTTSSPSTTPYGLQVRRVRRSGFETEPNDTALDAESFNSAGFAAGAIDTLGDADVFAFSASADRLVTISTIGDSDEYGESNGFFDLAGWGSQLGAKLEILATDGTTVLATSLSNSHAHLSTESVVDGLALQAVSFIAPADGTYFVRVTSDDGTFGADMLYALQKR